MASGYISQGSAKIQSVDLGKHFSEKAVIRMGSTSSKSCQHGLEQNTTPPGFEATALTNHPTKDHKPNSSDPNQVQSELPFHLQNLSPATIKVSDTPQWRWTSVQCQAWFYLVLITYMNSTLSKAEQLASQLEAFGPSLYRRSVQSWITMLGHENGEALYWMLWAVSREKGAIPSVIKKW